jgi:hypothetical protein
LDHLVFDDRAIIIVHVSAAFSTKPISKQLALMLLGTDKNLITTFVNDVLHQITPSVGISLKITQPTKPSAATDVRKLTTTPMMAKLIIQFQVFVCSSIIPIVLDHSKMQKELDNNPPDETKDHQVKEHTGNARKQHACGEFTTFGLKITERAWNTRLVKTLHFVTP